MKTYYFNTGVRPGIPSNERHIKDAKPVLLCKGEVWLNGTKQISFDCENVPEGATLLFLCDNPKLEFHENDIVAEVHNTTMLSKYAYFRKPYNPSV